MSRRLQIALPFVLIALGAAALFTSPWPPILHLIAGGARVRVIWTWRTLAPLLATGVCWTAAVWLSLRIRSPD